MCRAAFLSNIFFLTLGSPDVQKTFQTTCGLRHLKWVWGATNGMRGLVRKHFLIACCHHSKTRGSLMVWGLHNRCLNAELFFYIIVYFVVKRERKEVERHQWEIMRNLWNVNLHICFVQFLVESFRVVFSRKTLFMFFNDCKTVMIRSWWTWASAIYHSNHI